MNQRHTPDYLAGYPPALRQQVATLIEQGGFAAALRRRYPQAHGVRSDGALYDYVQALKAEVTTTSNNTVGTVLGRRLASSSAA